MVADRRHTTPQKGSEPMEHVGVEACSQEALEEKSMTDSIKGLGQVSCSHDCAEWRFSLVEAVRDFRGKREEGGDRGAGRAEAMLEGSHVGREP